MRNISEYINEARAKSGPVEIEYTPKDRDELIAAIVEVAKAQARRKVLNFNCIDTKTVQDMDSVFREAFRRMPAQQKKDFLCDQWDVSNVTSFRGMFYDCAGFTGKGLENWNVSSKCKILTDMFHTCSSLEEIDMSKWDLRGVTGMNGMFFAAVKLLSVKFPEEMPKLQSASSVLQFCTALTYAKFPKRVSGDVFYTVNMFNQSGSKHNRLRVDNLDSILLPKTDGDNVDSHCANMFDDCGILPEIIQAYVKSQNLSAKDIELLAIDTDKR